MPSVTGIDNDMPSKGYGVLGLGFSNHDGVRGESGTGTGVVGELQVVLPAQFITQDNDGVISSSHSGVGVRANSDNYIGVLGLATTWV